MKFFVIYTILSSQIVQWASAKEGTCRQKFLRLATAVAVALGALIPAGNAFNFLTAIVALLFFIHSIGERGGNSCIAYGFGLLFHALALMLFPLHWSIAQRLHILAIFPMVAMFPFCVGERHSEDSGSVLMDAVWRTSAYVGCIGLRVLSPDDLRLFFIFLEISIGYYVLLAFGEHCLWRCLSGLQMAHILSIFQIILLRRWSAPVTSCLFFYHFFLFSTAVVLLPRKRRLALVEAKGYGYFFPLRGGILAVAIFGICLHPRIFSCIFGPAQCIGADPFAAAAMAFSQILLLSIAVRCIVWLFLPSQTRMEE
ncbi:MAG: hypothetical protein LBI69_00520 [Puniceicoccales bacterium]|jgi:hypothetical protein|nr:hypothetical protein [Puniceicoccales bacterium]